MFTTEVWLTPIILLPGVALLTVSTAHRFGQIQAEFHRLLDHPDSHAQIVARSLLIRARLYRDALASLYASVGLFALGSLLGGVVNWFALHHQTGRRAEARFSLTPTPCARTACPAAGRMRKTGQRPRTDFAQGFHHCREPFHQPQQIIGGFGLQDTRVFPPGPL
jgi:hypothetical protein